jgi:hypothetical protein
MRRFILATVTTWLLTTALAASAHAGRVAWTLAVIGDQQRAVDDLFDSQIATRYERFTSQTEWLASHAATVNLRMVTQVGDIVEDASRVAEWDRALAAMQTLDTAANADGGVGIPWNVAYGNHEVIGGSRNPTTNPSSSLASGGYRFYFGSASGTHRYANQPAFQGVSSNDLNAFHIIHASDDPGSRPYLMLNLELDVPGGKAGTVFNAIQWAQNVIDVYPGMATIVTTHVFEGSEFGPPNDPYMFGFGHNDQIEVFDKLIKDNSQIFMVLSGHTSEDTHQVRLNTFGEPVFQMVTDYNKWLGTAGDGFFRLLEIDEEAGQVRVETYSALLDQFRTDVNSQFVFAVDFAGRFAAVPEPTAEISFITGCWLIAVWQSQTKRSYRCLLYC